MDGFVGWAQDINNHDEIVGSSLLWNKGIVSNFIPQWKGIVSSSGINDVAQIAGYGFVQPDDLYYHGFIWEDGALMNLSELAGLPGSTAHGINNCGEVIGSGRNQFLLRGIYLTQPSPTCSVPGDGRGLSPNADGSGEAVRQRVGLLRIPVRPPLAPRVRLSALRGTV